MHWYPDGLGDPQCLRFSNLRDAEGMSGHGNNAPRNLHLFVYCAALVCSAGVASSFSALIARQGHLPPPTNNFSSAARCQPSYPNVLLSDRRNDCVWHHACIYYGCLLYSEKICMIFLGIKKMLWCNCHQERCRMQKKFNCVGRDIFRSFN